MTFRSTLIDDAHYHFTSLSSDHLMCKLSTTMNTGALWILQDPPGAQNSGQDTARAKESTFVLLISYIVYLVS